MIETLTTIEIPKDGLWRVGKKDDPLRFYKPEEEFPPDPKTPRNRYDDLIGHYSTGYFASEPEGAIVESALNFRVDDKLAHLLDEDSVGPGVLPAAYRHNRLLVNCDVSPGEDRPNLAFVDIEDSANLARISTAHKGLFSKLGVKRLTLGHIHGDDRMVTCALASVLMYEVDEAGARRYAGIAFNSKYGSDHRCWAVFSDIKPTIISAVELEADDPRLKSVSSSLGIRFN